MQIKVFRTKKNGFHTHTLSTKTFYFDFDTLSMRGSLEFTFLDPLSVFLNSRRAPLSAFLNSLRVPLLT